MLEIAVNRLQTTNTLYRLGVLISVENMQKTYVFNSELKKWPD